MMIKTPVSYDETATVFYPYPQVDDVNGEFLFEVKDKEEAKEIVKRINMHDELVAAVKELKAFYDDRMAGNKEHQLSREIDELLERCK